MASASAAVEPLQPRTTAAPQAGILEGANPVTYNSSNPILLFIVQSIIVIIFCRILHWPLSYLNQPRVIAEVIGGILLGPSVMMRIPNFQESIFPTLSMPIFSNVASLGLIMFLFLVALEVDIRLFTSNWKIALSVGLAGMALPFALGIAMAWGLYNQFKDDPNTVEISFGVYALFIGTALAITAFPVLCRILTELNLLGSSVGVTVLAAGIGNDVTGWILLALCVALVNNSTGLAALWALLCVIGWTLFLTFAVRPCFIWCLRKTNSLQKGPTQGMVALTLGIVLVSAWFTGIIGVHPIFGAFLAGLICPHDEGFAVKLAEKIEDIVSVLFLPLYFASSGLSTNLGLLNDGITWAYVIGIIAVAFSGKIIGGTLAARVNKLEWRESFTIGVLMSCKGLVELIVLNIGLQAKILSDRTFTMFVVMALVTTVTTTPLVKWLYPPWYQNKMQAVRRGTVDKNGNQLPSSHGSNNGEASERLSPAPINRLLIYLRLDSLPGLFTFIALLGADGEERKHQLSISSKSNSAKTKDHNKETDTEHNTGNTGVLAQSNIQKPLLEVHGLRLLELTERNSSVMQVTDGDEYYSARDPVVNTFRTFSRLNDVAVSGKVAIVPPTSYAETLMKQAHDVASDFVIVPWSEYGGVSEYYSSSAGALSPTMATNTSDSWPGRFTDRGHLEFMNHVLANPTSNTGIFINHGLGGSDSTNLPVEDKTHNIFVPFFGGIDDRVALRFALRLARNPNVTLTVAHLDWSSWETSGGHGEIEADDELVGDDKATHKAAEVDQGVSAQDAALLAWLASSPPTDLVGRLTIIEINASQRTAIGRAVAQARSHVGNSPRNAGDIIIVGRSHIALTSGQSEDGTGPAAASTIGEHGADASELRRTIGAVAQQLVEGGLRASLLVVKAGGAGLHW
ncbi:Sodium/hydrogen exchanger family-domain-containing protein [Coniella lustricola]|uniref:Sodium/hydrogen exchanger family-domain-containing protein n=1 Tax=Coniella lustricola TaxID=2025994 RepID=A0A2T3A7P4_9PEZI|nr:Sodium/hydrogen exchanger family-domain-containing protein [Coniella lustricola]